MAKKPVCETPVCKTTAKGRVCPVLVPVYGKKGGCRQRRRDEFAPASLFQKRSGRAFITIGCLKPDWDAKARRCRKGTRALKITIPRGR